MKPPRVVTIDFETEPIRSRPHYPPRPVGVSIKLPNWKVGRYYAFGHVTGGNNCTVDDARNALANAWAEPLHKLFFNGKFDYDIAQTWFGLPDLPALEIEDAMFLVYLSDPHQRQLGLKPTAARLLDLPPDERDAVGEWLVANQKQLKVDGLLPLNSRVTLANSGEWICLAPGELVGAYANGDTTRTELLYQKLYVEIAKRGMLPAYEREKRLMPILLRNEREGMRCDTVALERDIPLVRKGLEAADTWLRKRLKTPDLELDNDKDVGDALDKCGIVTEWTLTKTGQRSVSKANLLKRHYKDECVFQMLGYRNRAATCLRMFMEQWLALAQATGGTIHTTWNQVRGSNTGDTGGGTRTGRPSTNNPNFLNVSKDFSDKGDGWSMPTSIALPSLPLVRRYVLPDAPTHWFGRRDFNQQELRILGHFEDGALQEAYWDNPLLDVHEYVRQAISDMLGIDLPRTPVKTLNFGYIYGQGVGSMAGKLDRPVDEIQKLRNAQLSAVPGLKTLQQAIVGRGKSGQAVRTWGGREYFAEPPGFSKKFNKWMTYEYKLLNYIIQGSAADCTKEALIRYDEMPRKEGRFLVTVYDEIDISVPKKALKAEMLALRDVMMSVEFDVPMLSDGEYGPNWADLQDLVEPKPVFNRRA
jgi:DNA polymerase I-like protein with 3'-5' exonuclease and polymerase domains